MLYGSCGVFECDASTRSGRGDCDGAGASGHAERPLAADSDGRDRSGREQTSDSASDHDSDSASAVSDLDPSDLSPELHVPDSSSALDSSSPQLGPESPVLCDPPVASDLDPWDPASSPELHVPDSESPSGLELSSLQPGPASAVLYAWDAPLAEHAEAAGLLALDAGSSPMLEGVLARSNDVSPATLSRSEKSELVAARGSPASDSNVEPFTPHAIGVQL